MLFKSEEELCSYLANNQASFWLRIDGVTDMTSLPKLPDAVTDLGISNCPNLTHLPYLPGQLSDSQSLIAIPELPTRLRHVRIVKCGRAELNLKIGQTVIQLQ